MRKKVTLGNSEINACVFKGDLKLEKSDVVVCATSSDLNLSKGKISSDLFKHAGNQVQVNLNVGYPNGIKRNEIAEVDSGQLPCQKLFFVVLYKWGNGKRLQDLETIIDRCLQFANDKGYQSIAFPALGTGLLNYPAVKVAQTTFQCIENFSNRNSSTSLKFVNIIIYYKDHQIYSVFQREAKSRALNKRRESSFTLPMTFDLSCLSFDTPSYWSSQGSDSGGGLRVAVDRKTFNDIETVMTSTWLSQFVGHGRDGVGLCNYSNIRVINVERVENNHLFSNYARRREVLRRKARQLQAPFEVLENIPGSGGDSIMTSREVGYNSVLTTDICEDINETYLFHGTTMDNVESITRNGLRVGNETSMFGKGIYAAESSTKADQYTDPKDRRQIKGEKQMFLIRVCLGKIFLAKSAKKFVGLPCTECNDRKCLCNGDSQCDSVVANGHWNFREFVVFDSSQVYPEYIITYERF